MRTNITRQFRSRERNVDYVVVSFPGTKVHGNETTLVNSVPGVYGDLFLATSLHRRRKGPGAQPPKNGVGEAPCTLPPQF